MSLANSTSLSLDTILEFIATFCVQHYQKTGLRTDGAGLADAIRVRFPGFKFSDIGLAKLADAIRIAEQRGLIVRHRDVKHLQISPGPQSQSPPGTEIKANLVNPAPRLRSDVWRAFVFVETGKNFFFNRSTGEVLAISSHDFTKCAEVEADPEIVRIRPIPADVQQAWMKEFIHKHSQLSEADAPIYQGQWWINFPNWLRENDTALEREWNQFRSGKIYGQITSWANQNDVDVTMVRSQAGPTHGACKPSRSSDRLIRSAEEGDLIKKAIIAALEEMPLEQLENLSIPIRFVIRHFQPR